MKKYSIIVCALGIILAGCDKPTAYSKCYEAEHAKNEAHIRRVLYEGTLQEAVIGKAELLQSGRYDSSSYAREVCNTRGLYE